MFWVFLNSVDVLESYGEGLGKLQNTLVLTHFRLYALQASTYVASDAC
jgi:hypothetical protein